MKVTRDHVTREGVIRFCAKYDRDKKAQALPSDLDEWPWDDTVGLDLKLKTNGLKSGVLAAYRSWQLAEFSITDLLQCAVFNGIFPGEPQALCQLVLRGKVDVWSPDRDAVWWHPIRGGSDIDIDSALIARPSVRTEEPAKWYIEDGSGRALALLQRTLKHGEFSRTAAVYLGREPDYRSAFIRSRPELGGIGRDYR
jgi:hypothetical protein